MKDLPTGADTVVIGGGTAGCAVAARLVEGTSDEVLLLEAGPDYGPRSHGRWPTELLDAGAVPVTHDWGYSSGDLYPGRTLGFERGRVIGGSSSVNSCVALWGSRLDYERWAQLAGSPWTLSALALVMQAVMDRLQVRVAREHPLTPFQQACLEGFVAAGIPETEDLNDLDQEIGVGRFPANISPEGVRLNAAFAYLDRIRESDRLRVVGGVLVDRIVMRGSAALSIRAIVDGAPRLFSAKRVVLSGGAYGSPAILLRSGIGPVDELRGLGIDVVADVPGVGRNLHDHPSTSLAFEGTEELRRAMLAARAAGWTPDEQVLAKLRTAECAEGFDIHVYPVGGPSWRDPSVLRWALPISCMVPRSRGSLRLASADPTVAPRIDHRYLSDPDGHDLRVLVNGIRLTRRVADHPPLRKLLGRELRPGDVGDDGALAEWVRSRVFHYYHPVGTCRMGPSSDASAVVGPDGALHAVDGLFVADASIIPEVPRANTNLPSALVGEVVAQLMIHARSAASPETAASR